MNAHDKEAASTRLRKSGIEEEQTLCNQALMSGDLDKLSDAAWVILCEEAAAKHRKSSRLPDTQE